MIDFIQTFCSDSLDPYYNLAVEQHLMELVPARCCILYLWQNQNTVVIGRNQNPWRECRMELLQREGGRLARRLSGGGAVYHDVGNLNFTFLLAESEYHVQRQLTVVTEACRSLGIQAELSGRNDVLVDGKKFSGNAFYKNGEKAYHHGTLMVNVDKEKLGRYLIPSKAKLEAKGVSSVRSRVANLTEFSPELTCEKMKERMIEAFADVYGLTPRVLTKETLDHTVISTLQARNSSWEWICGPQQSFTFTCEKRFPWGEVQVQLDVKGGSIKLARVYSDSMDWTCAPRLEACLAGIPFVKTSLLAAIQMEFQEHPVICQDLSCMFAEQEI